METCPVVQLHQRGFTERPRPEGRKPELPRTVARPAVPCNVWWYGERPRKMAAAVQGVADVARLGPA
eukprot:869410-Lingulodinium_polyedra.AAC.1